jgi:hypothetical protein
MYLGCRRHRTDGDHGDSLAGVPYQFLGPAASVRLSALRRWNQYQIQYQVALCCHSRRRRSCGSLRCAGTSWTERRRSRTYPPMGYTGFAGFEGLLRKVHLRTEAGFRPGVRPLTFQYQVFRRTRRRRAALDATPPCHALRPATGRNPRHALRLFSPASGGVPLRPVAIAIALLHRCSLSRGTKSPKKRGSPSRLHRAVRLGECDLLAAVDAGAELGVAAGDQHVVL